jgi:hypothetical protein
MKGNGAKVERSRIGLLVGAAALVLGGVPARGWSQAKLPEITVYKSPT